MLVCALERRDRMVFGSASRPRLPTTGLYMLMPSSRDSLRFYMSCLFHAISWSHMFTDSGACSIDPPNPLSSH